jgi:hypothetical protein
LCFLNYKTTVSLNKMHTKNGIVIFFQPICLQMMILSKFVQQVYVFIYFVAMKIYRDLTQVILTKKTNECSRIV